MSVIFTRSIIITYSWECYDWSVFISGGNAHSVVETRAFFLVVIAGLWYVKWQPYYGKALLLPKPQYR
ncbi:hypothetical protein EH63_10415 [Escherichia coli]|nr:hypothetical protein EH63_10415 [Escherichia coli]